MAIKAGQIKVDAEGTVVSRIQTAGITNMNFPREMVKEVGNAHSVGILRDIPDLSFDIDSVDVSCDAEALFTGVDPTTVVSGQQFDFGDCKPLDVLSPFKLGQNLYTVVNGLIVPYLTLDTVSYKFGLKANASQTFTARTDAVFYLPGSPYFQKYTFSGAGPYALAHAANPYFENGIEQFVHSLSWVAPDGTFGRLFFGADWTDTANNFTLTAEGIAEIPAGATLKATYGSLVPATYAQARDDATAPPVRPAAIKSRNIDVYLGNAAATPVFTRVGGVQAFNIDRKVNLDRDEEFGNSHFVSQDYDTADVTGKLQVKPDAAAYMFKLIRQITNVPDGQTAGVLSFAQLPFEVRISDPITSARLKTWYVPDGVFNPPPVQARVQTKLTIDLDMESESGQVLVFNGSRPGT